MHILQHSMSLDGITFRIAYPEDFDAVVKFCFKFFLQDEPMVKARGGVSMRDETVVAHIRELLGHGVTVIAVDDSNGNVVGHMINCLYTKDALRYGRQSLAELRSLYNDAYGSVMFACEEVHGPRVVFQRRPEDFKVMDFYGVSINPAYRRRGIAKNLVKHSLEVAVLAGCDSGTVICTSPFSRKIFLELGFDVWSEVSWADFRVDGEVMYDKIDFPVAACCYKKFRSRPLKGRG